jgi:hypothetical protein
VMFDKSEALNGELLKFVRAAEGRRAGAEAAEISRLAAAGLAGASLELLRAPAEGGAAGATVLEKALEDCRAAAAAMCVEGFGFYLIYFRAASRPRCPFSPAASLLPPLLTLCACRASLHENRNAVVDARAEAIQQQEALAVASREKLRKELQAQAACVAARRLPLAAPDSLYTNTHCFLHAKLSRPFAARRMKNT